MKFNKDLLKEKWVAYTIALCSAVLFYLVLTHLGTFFGLLKGIWSICFPVFMGFVIAYVLAPLEQLYYKNVLYRIEKEKRRHTVAVLLAILTVVFFFVVLMVALVPQVFESIAMFVRNLNSYVYSFQSVMQNISDIAAQHDIDLSQFISSGDDLLQSITRVIPENLNKILNASFDVGTRMFDWIISFILAIYLMMDTENLKRGLERLLRSIMPTSVYQSTSRFWSRCNRILVQYIAYDLLDGLIVGLCNWLFMLATGMPYVAIVSVVVGITNLAPTFGPMAGAVIGAFILVLVNPWYALWFLIFTVILQTLDGYVFKPRLFGEQLGVSSVWILISLIVGGRLLGVAGILLAIPFAAIGDFVYHDYIIRHLELKKEERRQQKAMDAMLETAAQPLADGTGSLMHNAVAQAAAEMAAAEQAAADAAAAKAAAAKAAEAAMAKAAAETAARAAEAAAAKKAADTTGAESVAESAAPEAVE